MATKWDKVPKLTDDVVESAKEDMRKSAKGRGVESSDLKGGAKEAVREAGKRAEFRNVGRAGLAGAALQGGYEAGRALDEATGIGKKLVDKSGLGDLADRVANNRDKVELSKESKERIARGDLEAKRESKQKVSRSEESTTEPSGKYRPGRNEEIYDDSREAAGGYKRGGVVRSSASRRADGIASKGKTRGKYL